MAHHFKCLFTSYLFAKFNYSDKNNLRDIVKKLKNAHVSKFQADLVTLTSRQHQPMAYHFKGLPTKYFLAKFHTSTMNSVRDIVHV